MTGFEPRTSGVRSDRSANWVTTTALKILLLLKFLQQKFDFFFKFNTNETAKISETKNVAKVVDSIKRFCENLYTLNVFVL